MPNVIEYTVLTESACRRARRVRAARRAAGGLLLVGLILAPSPIQALASDDNPPPATITNPAHRAAGR